MTPRPLTSSAEACESRTTRALGKKSDLLIILQNDDRRAITSLGGEENGSISRDLAPLFPQLETSQTRTRTLTYS